MAIYKVTIKDEGNGFHITWHNVDANTVDSFEQSAKGIMQDEIENLWQQSRHRLEIGRKLFRFLDGDARHLQRALDEAEQHGESLQLHLCTCKQTDDWPFELLAQEDTFLLPLRLHLVRQVSDWGEGKRIPPKNEPLKLLFMACSALDVKPELDFEREEESIFRVTEKLAVDIDVEDSGSLEGLRSQLEQEQYDIIHLSGHANIDKQGNPYFIMEDETGYAHQVFPDDLWNEALIENPPRLLFLSGCRTGEALDTGTAVSFARMLVEKHHIPAVLGWGRSVSDEQAIHAEKKLYQELSKGKTILEAVQRARYELAENDDVSSYPAWFQLRLFSNGMPLNSIVQKGQRQKPKPRRMVHFYLNNSRVKVLTEGFVGRRRQLQTSLRALKEDFNKVGVLLLGTGGLGKSCLAGKICQRFKEHTLIIVHGKLDAITLASALEDAFIISQDEKGRQILSQKMKMVDKLANLCATSFKEKNYLLLLDDFEQNLEGADKGQPESLMLDAVDLMKTLLHWLPLCGKMTQLIITCRYEFTLTEQSEDLVEKNLEKVWLNSFQESEIRKKAQELKNFLYYEDHSIMWQLWDAGIGNPRLMEWVDVLVGQEEKEQVPQLLAVIAKQKEMFINQHVIRELLQRGGKNLEIFLQWFSIYRRPVQIEGVQQVAEKAGIEGWKDLINEGMGLSLIEHHQVRQTYHVSPLLREELLSNLKDIQPYHQAAFLYYKKICEGRESFDPILTEEWIFHALGCGEEKTTSEQGGRLVKYLRERLAFRESRRIGEWILEEKKQDLANDYDAFLLNETALTIKYLGDHNTAISFYDQSLTIDRALYGESHYRTARDLNNLGAAWRALNQPEKALEYCDQAFRILKTGDMKNKHPYLAGAVLDNLGAAWSGKGDYKKAIEYYEQALAVFKEIFGENHPNVAIVLNNLGAAWQELGDLPKTVDYYKKALAIDLSVYGKIHPDVATDLNNLGSAFYDQQDYQKAIEYYEDALTIWRKIYRQKHQNIAVTLYNLGKAYAGLEQKEKAQKCFDEAEEHGGGLFSRKPPP